MATRAYVTCGKCGNVCDHPKPFYKFVKCPTCGNDLAKQVQDEKAMDEKKKRDEGAGRAVGRMRRRGW